MKKSYIVDTTCNDMRLDRWLRTKVGNIPQSLIEKYLRTGKIKINKKKIKSSHKIKTKDEISTFNINFKERIQQKKNKFVPSKEIIKSNEDQVIYNNNDFIVLNKASGISVQGGTKSKKNLIDIFAKSNFFKDTTPYSVHRLDKDTSGVFIMAKNRKTAQLLTSLFRLRKVHKTYLAICQGEISKKSGIWEDDLIRYENNKKLIEKAKTTFNVIDKNSEASLLELKPITGRKHQLRKQLYAIGHPIFGDTKYKLFNYKKGVNKNLMLHSYQLKFKINEVKHTYSALLPDYFTKLLKSKRLSYLNLK